MVSTVTDNSTKQINTALFSLEKENNELKQKIELLQKAISNTDDDLNKLKQKLVGVEKDGSVISVNGKQGIVELNAGDVHALSDKTVIPEPQQQVDWNADSGITSIKNKPSIPTKASDIGALPDTTVIPPEQVNSDWNATNGKAKILNKPDLSVYATKASVEAIEELIPDTATSENQLADKDFVNSSIATNTSYFVGTFDTLEELESQTATNNDYAFWKTTDSDGNVVYKRYKYNGSEWAFEYDLNNSSFTAEQWATINSGLTETNTVRPNDIEPNATVTEESPKLESIGFFGTNYQLAVGNQKDINEADYEDLSDEEKDSDTTWFVPDSEGVDIEVINDEQISEETTWSSEKISKTFDTFNFNSIHIVDITVGEFTCTSIGQQFKVPLSSFGKIDKDKVIGFTVLHWGGIKFIADGDWYESGTGDAGFGCAITPLQTGTGWARVRCVYFS